MPLTVDGIPEVLALDGRDLGHSDWKEITQELIDAYADVSGDHQWIHTDVERAASGPYGRTIAHGYMVLGWGIPMFAELLRVEGWAAPSTTGSTGSVTRLRCRSAAGSGCMPPSPG